MTSAQKQQARRRSRLTIYLFNVGQGDHIFLRLPGGEYGIIDFHYGSGLSAPPALGYLQKLRRRLNPKTPIVISFICLSHPDYDHVKGAKSLLDWVKDKRNNVELKNLWMWPGTILEELRRQFKDYGVSLEPSDTTARATEAGLQVKTLLDFRDVAARSRKTKVSALRGVQKLTGNAGGVKAVALAPLEEHVKKFDRQALRDFVKLMFADAQSPTAEQNLVSSILMLVYDGHRLLFGGDTGGKIWRDCLRHYQETAQFEEHGPFKGCFVKASHHGSKNSSSPELWPEVLFPGAHVGISAGIKNAYGHPDADTLEHILGAFKKAAECPKIYATNSCHDCINSQRLPVKHINWVATVRTPPDEDDEVVERTLNDVRWKPPRRGKRMTAPAPKSAHPKSPNEPLAAYIFQFGAEAKIKVSKGVSSRLKLDKESCRYSSPTPHIGQNSPPFPQCAVPRT